MIIYEAFSTPANYLLSLYQVSMFNRIGYKLINIERCKASIEKYLFSFTYFPVYLKGIFCLNYKSAEHSDDYPFRF